MATPIKDLTGKTFNRWFVIEQAPSDPARSQTLWRCRCTCGVVREAVAYCSLTSGRSGSCGCVKREQGERRRAMKESANHHNKHMWWGKLMKLTEIARQENVDAMELRRRYLCQGIALDCAVMALKHEGRVFHERAASYGATGETRTGKKRTRHVANGKLLHPICEPPPPDPLADIW